MSQTVDFAQLVENAADAFVVSDADGLITVRNGAAERMFGFSAAEAIGRTLDLITPERHRERHWTGYAKTMETGVTKYGDQLLRVPALRKDGSALSIAFTVTLLTGHDGEVTGIAAIIRDETDRFGEERQLRRRVAELEATRSRAEAQ